VGHGRRLDLTLVASDNELVYRRCRLADTISAVDPQRKLLTTPMPPRAALVLAAS
jgi:hypothetical protein